MIQINLEIVTRVKLQAYRICNMSVCISSICNQLPELLFRFTIFFLNDLELKLERYCMHGGIIVAVMYSPLSSVHIGQEGGRGMMLFALI